MRYWDSMFSSPTSVTHQPAPQRLIGLPSSCFIASSNDCSLPRTAAGNFVCSGEGRVPSEALVDSAHQTIGNLVEWRDTLLETTRLGSNDPKKALTGESFTHVDPVLVGVQSAGSTGFDTWVKIALVSNGEKWYRWQSTQFEPRALSP